MIPLYTTVESLVSGHPSETGEKGVPITRTGRFNTGS